LDASLTFVPGQPLVSRGHGFIRPISLHCRGVHSMNQYRRRLQMVRDRPVQRPRQSLAEENPINTTLHPLGRLQLPTDGGHPIFKLSSLVPPHEPAPRARPPSSFLANFAMPSLSIRRQERSRTGQKYNLHAAHHG
jgi:hypothetical protein